MNQSELDIVRRAFAKQVMAAAGADHAGVEAGFATVRREAFLAPGPWRVLRWGRGYVPTPSGDPVYLLTDDVVAILPEKHINNGQPSLHAGLMASAAPRPGEHVVHVGAGVGYYTAILAEAVGPSGCVTAIEFDPDLAERARANSPPAAPPIHRSASTGAARFRIERQGRDYGARWLSPVAIYPCAGMRDAARATTSPSPSDA